ncbi:hypothetical protein PV326_004584 [Microctonus aethiopoides]|nr:hypothetical protein PV326_004584 [Microctonus aethiopoides]
MCNGVNFWLIISGSDFARTADTKSIQAMAKLWLRLTERRKHKKGQEEEQAKRRTRRAQKFNRAIVGASLSDILAKRNMKPEIRKAQRDQAIKAAKEQKKAAKAVKKSTAPPKPKPTKKEKATKVTQKAAPRVGGKR